jgi:hypothetical protein
MTHYPSSAPSGASAVIRARHPFEGRALNVLETIHRKRRLHLVLILPDGSKSLIPANWTDLASPAQPHQVCSTQTAATLGSLEDLLHARAVVDALLSRLAARQSENGNSPATQESPGARKQSEPLRSASPRNLPVGNTTGRAQNPRDRHPGTAHRERKPT